MIGIYTRDGLANPKRSASEQARYLRGGREREEEGLLILVESPVIDLPSV